MTHITDPGFTHGGYTTGFTPQAVYTYPQALDLTQQLKQIALQEANKLKPADLDDLLDCAEHIYKWLTTGQLP